MSIKNHSPLTDTLCPQHEILGQASHTGAGVNAKIGCSKQGGRPLSTPARAGVVANFHLSHAERVVAISELHADVDSDQLEALLSTDAFILKLMQSYQGTGELPDWAKFVSPEMKHYFRILNRPWFSRHSPSSGNSVSHTLLETAA